MKANLSRPCAALILLFALCLCLFSPALAESYDASTMRLLKYQGEVRIEDASGQSRFLMENVRFDSGETLITGEGASASVGLDDTKIVSLDQNSRVTFRQNGGAMVLTLEEGALFLDVSQKLDANESLDIETSNMTVGIHGTIVFVEAGRGESDPDSLMVLEGQADLYYQGVDGRASIQVPVNMAATIYPPAPQDRSAFSYPEVQVLTPDDVTSFMLDTIDELGVTDRVQEGCPWIGTDTPDTQSEYSAQGDWTWKSPVTLVAQSASKLYDGHPLSRPGNVLVFGLPSLFTVSTTVTGLITDAGVESNQVTQYAILNEMGEDVTSHFAQIETVDGQLVVDPAPLTIWTASAEKTYDGTPLTAPEAGIFTVPGYEKDMPVWRNASYVYTQAYQAEVLYGISGVTWVHGTNPVTTDTREIQLKAGEKLSVRLTDGEDDESIAFQIEPVSETDLPEELLRLYADNPDLLAQACQDADWDQELILSLIAALPTETPDRVEQSDLSMAPDDINRLMLDSANVRITIDSGINNYSGRILGQEEAHYYPVVLDPSIRVTATGSQTDVGESINGYTIDWGSANPANYVLSEDLGTLTVTPAPLTVTTGSASKEYDGTPLTSPVAQVAGLVADETAYAAATGTLTDVGTMPNTYALTWDSANPSNYEVIESLGTLTVTPNAAAITLTAESLTKTYDGQPLTASEVTAAGLPQGFTLEATARGSQTMAGASESAVDSYRILKDGQDVTASFTDITTKPGTLTVEKASLTVTTGSAAKTYDGQPLTSEDVSVSGLIPDETLTVTATGALTDVGTAENTCTLAWGSANPSNYAVTESLGTLTVTPNAAAITLTPASLTKTYDGKPLSSTQVTAAGLPQGFTLEATARGTQTAAGTSESAIESFRILKDGQDVTAFFTGVTTQTGILTVEKAPLTVATGSASKQYDGQPLTSDDVSVSGLISGETLTVAAEGTITDVGTAQNTCALTWGTANPSNYDVTENPGTLTVTPNTAKIVIASLSADMPYQGGEPLTCEEYQVTGLPDGFYAMVSITGEQTNVGQSANTISEYRILLIDSEEDKTANFTNIETSEGTLTVTPALLTVSTPDITKPYDGTPASYTVTAAGLFPSDADKAVFAPACDQVDAGTAQAGYTLTWLDDAARANYDSAIAETLGTVTITPAPLTVSTPSASKTFDGEPLTAASGASLTGLVSGETATVTATGSLLTVGSTPNTYTLEWGTAKSSNYAPTESLGTLTVTPNTKEILLIAASDTKPYDGTALANPEVYWSDDALSWPFDIFAEAAGSQTDAGTSDNVVSNYTIYQFDEEENMTDVTACFTGIVTQKGTLTVTPADLTVSSADAEKVYDGTPLTTAAVNISGLADGDTITVAPTGSITDVGTAQNTFTIDWGSTKSGNYNLTTQTGTLTVTPLTVLVNLHCDTVFFNAYPHFPPAVTATYGDGSAAAVTYRETYEYEGAFASGCTAQIALRGNALLNIVCNGGTYIDTYTYPTTESLVGNAGNYSISYINNILSIVEKVYPTGT